jgi:hypothetical protein
VPCRMDPTKIMDNYNGHFYSDCFFTRVVSIGMSQILGDIMFKIVLNKKDVSG